MNKKTINKIVITVSIFIILIVVLSIPYLMLAAGKSNLEKNNILKAYKQLRKAYILRPKNRDIRYYYVKSMTELKPTEKIQIEIYKFSQSKIPDSARELANHQVNLWKNNILSNIGDNYIEQASYDKNLLRWDINSFPLKVRLDIPISTPDYYREEIEKAFTDWSLSTGFLEFEFVESGKADIIVKFNPLPDNICEDGICKYVVGYTNPIIKGKILKSMTITMYDKDVNGNYFSDKELYNTILHEIGHALGIMGHSYSSDDLMYMSTQPNSNITRYRSDFQFLSQDDLNTINLLYKLIPDISNVPMSKFKKEGLIYAPIVLGNEKDINKRKIEEAKNYIESAPELPGGYIDLAIAYAEIEKYSDAIATLREALEHAQTDNDRYIIYYNIAVIHLNSNRLEEAEKYINMAKDLNSSDEILELESNLNHAKASNKKPFRTNLSN